MSTAGPTPRRDTAWLWLALVTFLASAFLCTARRPLNGFARIADEWWLLGLNVAVSGTLGLGQEAFVYRPPGYPAFIGAVLRLFTDVPGAQALTPHYVDAAMRLVALTQCLLHAVCTAALYAWMRRRVRAAVALAAALAFGLNPYSLILCGLLHYDVLHLLLLTLSGWATAATLERPTPRPLALVASGGLWGLTTLVRAVTLPLPLFIPLVVLLRERTWSATRKALLVTTLLTAGMAATIAPWTLRNYRLTHAFVPVNAEGWTALWGSTVKPLPLDPNRYLWYLLANSDDLLPVVQRVTERPDYHYYEYMSHGVEIDAALRDEALRNLRSRPQVYARNVLRSFITFNVHINSVLVSAFERLQNPAPQSFQPDWAVREGAPERQPTPLSRAFDAFVGVCSLLALYGVVSSLRRKDSFLLVPAAVYACICLAHTFTYMDLMYYYVKLPFLILFAAVGIEAAHATGRQIGFGRVRVPLGTALAGLIAAGAVALTVALFWVTAP